jgi:hypothetical protein
MGAVAGFAAPAFADASSDPTDCTNVVPGTTADCPDYSTPGVDSNPLHWFVPLMVIAGIAGIGTTVWRVRTARALAEDAGMDPGRATAITLLGNDGLDAAYIASAVHAAHQRGMDPRQRPDLPIPRPTSAEDRLRELQRLHEQGLVTDEEYTHRRSAIVDTL